MTILSARVCLLLLLLSIAAPGQTQSETNHEVWPEIDVYVPINKEFRLNFMGRVNKSRETGDDVEGHLGIHLDYFWREKWNLRSGYRYVFELGDAEEYSEHRILFEETYHKSLGEKYHFTDRNRQELRWINGSLSARFRNRPKLEREFKLKPFRLVPYGAVEIFYDTRFNTFNRSRFIGGVQFIFKKGETFLLQRRRQRSLDVYYLFQHDTRSSSRRTEVVGITFSVYF